MGRHRRRTSAAASQHCLPTAKLVTDAIRPSQKERTLDLLSVQSLGLFQQWLLAKGVVPFYFRSDVV